MVKESSVKAQQDGLNTLREDHWWLDPHLVENLPIEIQRGKDSSPVMRSAGKIQQTNNIPLSQCNHFFNAVKVNLFFIVFVSVLCVACRETRTADGLFSYMTGYLPKKVTSYIQIPYFLPVELVSSLSQRYLLTILYVGSTTFKWIMLTLSPFLPCDLKIKNCSFVVDAKNVFFILNY